MRYFLLSAVAGISSLLAASDFWNSTKPAAWSDGQTQEFLTKSPWVHYFRDIQVASDFCRPGPRGGCTYPLVPAGFSLEIRWESAELVREALTRIESKEYNDALAGFSRDYYVIAIMHVRTDGSRTGQTSLSGHWSPEMEEELRTARAIQPRLGLAHTGPPIPVLIGNEQAEYVFSVSRLLRPGYEAILAARVESGNNAEGAVDLVMFPRSAQLEKVNGDLDFITTIPLGMGRSPFRARFSLKALAEGFERGL